MGKLDWIRDLVRAEQQLEESDMIDFSVGFDEQKLLEDETITFFGTSQRGICRVLQCLQPNERPFCR